MTLLQKLAKDTPSHPERAEILSPVLSKEFEVFHVRVMTYYARGVHNFYIDKRIMLQALLLHSITLLHEH
jgi:hypothetical protein